MDDEKKTTGEQQNSQQQSTMQNQQGGSDVEQPVETPTTTSQSGTGNQGNTSNTGSATGSGSATSGDQGMAAGSGSATSGDQGMAAGSGAGQDANEQARLSGAEGKELIGKTLIGANDQQVGEVNDVVVGGDGNLKSVLINVGGFLGIGDKTVAVPADQIQVQGDNVIARELTKESAENMPEYKKANEG